MGVETTGPTADTIAFVEDRWEQDLTGALCEFIRIPNVSPAYEPGWAEAGHMDRAVDLLVDWIHSRPIDGLRLEVHRLEGRTPVILIEIDAANGGPAEDTVLLYGHLDKQPEFHGWREGLGPWEPVLDGDRLYGRGGADDGYSTFAALTAIEAAQRAGDPHARCVVFIEASEESGSPDLVAHVEALGDRIGRPSLVVCLDSGCQDYDRLWVTTSLRGVVGGRLEAAVGAEGVHSGEAGGVMPSSFAVLRQLLDRVENPATGEVHVPEFHVEVPPDRHAEVTATGRALNEPPSADLPLLPGVTPMAADAVEQLLRRTWQPTLEVTGADGLPPTARAGNVLRAATALQLSLRLPPTADDAAAAAALARLLTMDPPHGAHVTWTAEAHAPGWNAPTFAPWLWSSLDASSHATFGAGVRAFGEGGTIPFMHMLGARFPDAQFAVMGVLGPASNAHGPNEFLHLPTARRLTATLAALLRDHATRGE